MSDESPQDDSAPSFAEAVAEFLATVQEKLLSKPFPEEIEQVTGHPISEYKLAKRELTVNPWECGAGHKHKWPG